MTPTQRRKLGSTRRGLTNCDRPSGVTWRNAGGAVVATFDQGANLSAAPFVTGVRTFHTFELSPHGLGSAHIGQPASTAETAIARLLGSRTVTHATAPGCPADHVVVWTSPAVATPLTIYERGGRFVGYGYGAPVQELGFVRGPGAVLVTSRGVTVGDDVGTARKRYGSAFRAHAFSGGLHGNGGGVWSASSDGGTLGGALTPYRYPMTKVTSKNRIATITAGQTGCG